METGAPSSDSPTPPDSTGEADALRRTAIRVVEELAAIAADEVVLVTVPSDRPWPFADAVIAATAELGATAHRLPIGRENPEAGAQTLAAAIDSVEPTVVLELADITLYRSQALSSFVAGGGRSLGLMELSVEAACRLVGRADLGSLRRMQALLIARLESCSHVRIETADAALEMILDPRGRPRYLRRILRAERGFVFFPTPIPCTRGLLSFLLGQISFLGRRSSMRGAFVADAYNSHPPRSGESGTPIRLEIRRGLVTEATGGLSEGARRSIGSGPRIEHVSIGFLDQARVDAGLMEAERVAGSVNIGFGEHPMHIDVVASRPTVLLDGEPLIESGRLVAGSPPPARPARRRGPARRAVEHLRPMIVRSFQGPAGRMSFVGTCPQEPPWLLQFSGRPAGRVSVARANLFGIARLLENDDLTLVRATALRRRLDSLESGCLSVPTLVQQRLPLQTIREEGLRSLVSDHSSKESLRVLRREGLTASVCPARADGIAEFVEHYYVPTMRRRHGSLVGFFSLSDLLAKADGAEFVRVLRGDDCVSQGLIAPEGDSIRLIAVGVREGDERLLRIGALTATYLLPAEIAAQRGALYLALGGSLPFLHDPVLRFKAKWRAVAQAPAESDRYSLRIRLDRDPAMRFLERNPLVAIDDAGELFALAAPTTLADVDRLHRIALPGVNRLVAVIDTDQRDLTEAMLQRGGESSGGVSLVQRRRGEDAKCLIRQIKAAARSPLPNPIGIPT